MVNWYAVGLAAAIIYILPKRRIAQKLFGYYKYKAISRKIVIVILDDIGMNYEKTRKHARSGAKIIIGSQNPDKAEKAKRELISSSGNRNILIVPINRNDKNSVKTFAENIIKTEKAVDVLISNEGFELSDLDINFKKQELAIERFENHCLNFLHEDDNTKNYKLQGWYQSISRK